MVKKKAAWIKALTGVGKFILLIWVEQVSPHATYPISDWLRNTALMRRGVEEGGGLVNF